VFVRKSVHDVEKELSDLNKRIDKLEKELVRLEQLERMQAQHEIILAKKIADINRVEAELEKRVHRDDLDEIKKELKKIDEHEAVLVENSKFMREIINELGKIKQAHRITKEQFLEKGHYSKEDVEEKLFAINDAMTDLEHIRKSHRKKAEKEDLETVRKEFHERMEQIEYQNKLLLSYLKKVDELLHEKL
jgi:hypothetical protein